MKSKTKATRPNGVPLKYDKIKYKEFRKCPPIDFTRKSRLLSRYVYMKKDEFAALRPRLIHSDFIAWTPGSIEEQKPIWVHIYITDGHRTEGEIEIQVAYSYFVRFGERTWMPYSLDQCFEIVNALRLEQLAEEMQKIKADIRCAKMKKAKS